jgi:hypothetical protein
MFGEYHFFCRGFLSGFFSFSNETLKKKRTGKKKGKHSTNAKAGGDEPGEQRGWVGPERTA